MSRTFRHPMYYFFYDSPEDEWKRTRDTKRWEKPPKWYKQMNRRREKAKEKDALKHEKDIPKFKKHDMWMWT